MPSTQVQADEKRFIVYAKNDAKPKKKRRFGDTWEWVAIDADSKFACAWHVGDRERKDAKVFPKHLVSRLRGKADVVTDGHKTYSNLLWSERAIRHDFSITSYIERNNLTMRMSVRRL